MALRWGCGGGDMDAGKEVQKDGEVHAWFEID